VSTHSREVTQRAPVRNLQGLLDELEALGCDGETVSVADIQQRLGRRAFGPMLLAAALPSLTPIATIPALPSILSVIVIFTAGQLVLGRNEFWLPRAILDRAVSRATMVRVIGYLRPLARFIDRLIKPRLKALTGEPFVRLIAACCCFLALFKVPLEFIPFTGGIPAFPIAVYGLGLMARDGAVVIFGMVATVLALILLALIALVGVTFVEEMWRVVFD
jgi:hypothetical protein